MRHFHTILVANTKRTTNLIQFYICMYTNFIKRHPDYDMFMNVTNRDVI